MKISVIMLTYNRREFLPKMIETVQKQTMKDFEFIIVDNGSEDGSGELIESYRQSDSRIISIKLPKSSIATGRSIGLSKAGGEFIAYIDDDDWLVEDYLETLLNHAQKQDADIAYCGSYKEENGSIRDNCVPAEAEVLSASEAVIRMLKRRECNAALPSKLIRRELFEGVEFPAWSKHEDIFVTYKLLAKANRVATCSEKKYCFVRHGKNISAFTTNDSLLTPEQLEEYFGAFQERTEYLAKALPDIADYAQYSEWSYLISMCNKIESNHLKNCVKQLEYARKTLLEHYDEFYGGRYILDFEKAWMEKYIVPYRDIGQKGVR